jgi:Uma2 family endonuclease
MAQSPTASTSERSRYHGQAMSVAQYLALPEEKPYLEYVDGVVTQKAMPTRKHSILTRLLNYYLTLYIDSHGGNGGPELRTKLAIGRFRLPDTAYWAPDKPFEDGRNALPPTLAIEIRSPGEPMADQRAKCRMYREHGVDVCWLFDPEARTVERFEDDADGETMPDVLESPYLPGFSLGLAQLWAALDR